MNALLALPRPVRWLLVAILGALCGIALQLATGDSGAGDRVRLTAADPTAQVSAAGPAPTEQASASGPAAAVVPAPPESSNVDPASGDSADPSLDGSDATAAAPGVPVAPADTGMRIRIPAIAVDSRIVALGFNADGQLDVPSDGTSVGWYDITPRPGEAGNALLGAHFDWDGSLAVFAALAQLTVGDRVVVDAPDGAVVYEVSEATAVPWDRPLTEVLAAAGDRPSLTLFTCGGSFDADRGEYDERVVVRAIQVDSSQPLTARR